MKHLSIPVDQSLEFVDIQAISPFISKCTIKVCYVQDELNRNNNIITKDTARKLAQTLPGCPIVGHFSETKGDFEEHNPILAKEDGKWVLTTNTVPYGFVDINARVWFQKFLDDNEVIREYLVTEGYIWTEQFPEAKKILENKNNQSMEIDKETLQATWVRDRSGEPQFFIVNDGIISKLCILGEEEEPCFEGCNIRVNFSLNDDIKTRFYSMMDELKEVLNKGGQETMNENQETLVVEEEVVETTDTVVDEVVVEEEVVTVETENENFSQNADETEQNDNPENDNISETEITYSLEDIPEYVELSANYSALETNYNSVVAERDALAAKNAELVAFKARVERQEKQDMIDSFYMLSDEDKEDVVNNIETYSLDEIEAKLSILCVRNKVDFNLTNNNAETQTQGAVTYSLDSAEDAVGAPSWIKTAKRIKETY